MHLVAYNRESSPVYFFECRIYKLQVHKLISTMPKNTVAKCLNTTIWQQFSVKQSSAVYSFENRIHKLYDNV